MQGVTRIACHLSQPLLFTACLDGAVRCWDIRSGRLAVRAQHILSDSQAQIANTPGFPGTDCKCMKMFNACVCGQYMHSSLTAVIPHKQKACFSVLPGSWVVALMSRSPFLHPVPDATEQQAGQAPAGTFVWSLLALVCDSILYDNYTGLKSEMMQPSS